MGRFKLISGDEQFDAYRKLAKMISHTDEETAAYVLERFSTEYYLNSETPAMSLSFAKQTLSELT